MGDNVDAEKIQKPELEDIDHVVDSKDSSKKDDVDYDSDKEDVSKDDSEAMAIEKAADHIEKEGPVCPVCPPCDDSSKLSSNMTIKQFKRQQKQDLKKQQEFLKKKNSCQKLEKKSKKRGLFTFKKSREAAKKEMTDKECWKVGIGAKENTMPATGGKKRTKKRRNRRNSKKSSRKSGKRRSMKGGRRRSKRNNRKNKRSRNKRSRKK